MSSSMMSSSQVAFEPRDFMHDGNYPSIGDHHVPGQDPDNTFTTHHHEDVANELNDGVNFVNTGVSNFDGADDLDLDTPPSQNHIQNTPSPPTDQQLESRTKSAYKPKRVAVKNANGKYECTWEGCDEVAKEFVRKCEFDKHMDKHERPYRCNEDGCGKLPGFTYSGGLLRHEREVHKKHGGPKNRLTCPHNTCKRYQGQGKPFSRQENLDEHLRRVHAYTPEQLTAFKAQLDNTQDMPTFPSSPPPQMAGQKRRRSEDVDDDVDVAAVLEENKRLKAEADELRRQVHNLNVQTNQLLTQLAHQASMDQANGLTLDNGAML